MVVCVPHPTAVRLRSEMSTLAPGRRKKYSFTGLNILTSQTAIFESCPVETM